jgi:hypothetical protein
MESNRTSAGESRANAAQDSAANRAFSQSPTSNQKRTKSDHFASHNPRAAVRATTFGIELEFVFAFKEYQLKNILSKYDLSADIIKTMTPEEHRDLVATFGIANGQDVPAYSCRQRSPSWALHVPNTDLVCRLYQHKGMFSAKSTKNKRGLRRYVMEPLLIAKQCLAQKGLPSNVVGWIETNPSQRDNPEAARISWPQEESTDDSVMLRNALVDYSKWTLVNDHTIVGALRSQLQDHLERKGVVRDEIADWDSYGIEMISPVFELAKKEDAFKEVGNYLTALRTKETSTFDSVWASSHVHVGFNFERPEDMPILQLQHLAYILVQHEDLISKCHPRSRCGVRLPQKEPEELQYDEEEDFDPDASFERPPAPTEEELAREDDQHVLVVEKEYTGCQKGVENVRSNAQHLAEQLQRENLTTKDAIFQQDGTIFELVGRLQRTNAAGNFERGYMYNFANLVNLALQQSSWKPVKPTVEFRQHACALDPTVLKHWVSFLESIVRKADEMASSPVQEDEMQGSFASREEAKYMAGREKGSWPSQSMRTFCVGFLDLNDEAGEFWQGRYDLYKDDRP